MFNMIDGIDYYFSSRQEIVIKDDSSKRELGEIVELEVLLTAVVDTGMDKMRKLMKQYDKAMKVLGDNDA